jgi:hypothetical protein
MLTAKAAGKAAVLIRVIHMIVGIVAAAIMANPLSAIVNVRGIGVAGLVAIAAILLGAIRFRILIWLGRMGSMRLNMRWFRPTLGNGLAVIAPLWARSFFVTLRKCGHRKNEHCGQSNWESLHFFTS